MTRRKRAGTTRGVMGLFLLTLAVTTSAGAQARPPDRYELTAKLDPVHHTVEGTATIHWTNRAVTPARVLWFHLYLNAFASKRTVFMRESAGSLRGVRSDGRGRIELRELRTVEGADLLAQANDTILPHDRTQLRVRLPQPLPPGKTIRLQASFRSELPPVFARTGWTKSFHMVAQWFPKLAYRHPDGRWESFPYHGHGEFFAEFATYQLTVTTPRGFRVGATGKKIDEKETRNEVSRTFLAERVHDAAFCAWDHFHELHTTVGRTAVSILSPPGYEAAVRRHRITVEAGLRHFGSLFGPYPYPTLTVIVPPAGAEGAAGMEYPTLFVAAGPWWSARALRIGLQEDVTAHELAHQWFQGLVATNEVRWPMLDEGLTQWSTGELLRSLHGASRSAVDLPGFSLDFFQLMRVFSFSGEHAASAPGQPAYAFDRQALGRAVYARPAIVLETIARTWGRSKLVRALGTYARTHRYGHPSPDDLFAAFDRVYWIGFSDAVLQPALLHNADAEAAVTRLRTRRRKDQWITRIEARRLGPLPVPLTLEITDSRGKKGRFAWPGRDRHLRITHRSKHRVTQAVLDPHRHNLLDPRLADNKRRTEAVKSERSWFGPVLHLMQTVLGALGP